MPACDGCFQAGAAVFARANAGLALVVTLHVLQLHVVEAGALRGMGNAPL